MGVQIAPTLGTMAELYGLSRTGGPASPRFRAYLSRVEQEWGLAAYNPMAGTAALEAVQRLRALDAEALSASAGNAVAAACDYPDEITLAVVVRAEGMWTDRIATELEQRIWAIRREGHGLVNMWSGEIVTADDIRRESGAEAARVMWTALHGRAESLGAVLEREGFAYAAAAVANGVGPAFEGTPTALESASVQEAVTLLHDSTEHSDIAGVLFGDPAAIALGWTPPGVPDRAGYRWATHRAMRAITAGG